MPQELLTTYGRREFAVTPLHGSAVLITGQDHVIPAGTRWDGDRTLKAPVTWRRGTLLIPRLLLNRVEGAPATFLWSAFPYGLYEALRALMHTKRGYHGVNGETGENGERDRPGEILKLGGVREALNLALEWLALRPTLTRYRREALRALLRDNVDEIENVRDPAKRRALLHMVLAVRERDRLGRPNPSRRMAILVGARNDLRDRLNLIAFIEPRIGAREIALLHEATRIRHIFNAAYKAVERAHREYQVERREQYRVLIEVAQAELETIYVGPYPAHIERIVRDIQEAVTAMSESRVADVKERLRIIRESLRCKRARWDLEELLVRLSLFVRGKRSAEEDKVALVQFEREISDFRNRVVSKIDDRGFAKPVCEPVSEDLRVALVYLISARAGGLSHKMRQQSLLRAKAMVEHAARKL